MNYFSVWLFGVTLLFSINVSARVTIENHNDTHSDFIKLSGQITKEDVGEMRKALDAFIKVPEVELDSIGGDVDAALKIGDLLYNKIYDLDFMIDGNFVRLKLAPFVMVYGAYQAINGQYFKTIKTGCASACVFIYASAKARLSTSRIYAGGLVIHSPYTLDTNLSYEEIKEKREDLRKRAIYQFQRVGVSPELWTLMESVPSEKSYALSQEEIKRLGLDADDPAYADYRDSFEAKLLGVSKQEYMRRKNIQSSCESSKEYKDSAIRFLRDPSYHLLDCSGMAGLTRSPERERLIKRLN